MGVCFSQADDKQNPRQESENTAVLAQQANHQADDSKINADQDTFVAHIHAKIARNDQAAVPVIPSDDGGSMAWKLRKFYGSTTRHRLAELMDSKQDDFVVLDVRDPSLDYPGGHIRGCLNVHHEDFIKTLPRLIAEYHHKANIIVHCMYSQSRGPLCCQLYCSGIECLLKHYGKDKAEQQFACVDDNSDFEILKSITLDEATFADLSRQNVLLRKGGFRGWLNEFQGSPRYVEEFDMEHWEYETVGGRKELYHKNDW